MPAKRKVKQSATNIAIERWTKEHMPFLMAAENRETFFRRVAGFLPELDPGHRAIRKAYDTTKDVFRDVRRDSGERYFEHLRGVALIDLEYLEIRDYEIIVAGFLHDIVEDKPKEWSIQRIRNEFGDRVALLIQYLSQPKESEFASKQDAEDAYHARFEFAPRDFFVIKLADRLHNLLTLGTRPRHKQIAKIKETEQFYMPYARRHLILLPELRTVLKILKYQN